MMKKFTITLCILASTLVQAKDILWTDKPIGIELPVSKEIYIRFPHAVATTNILNPVVSQKISQILTPQGVLYITAQSEFEATRMIVDLVTGQLIMTDISAKPDYQAESLRILDPKMRPPKTVIRPVSQKKTKKSKPKVRIVKKKKKTPLNPNDNPNLPSFLKQNQPKTLNARRSAHVSYADIIRFAFRQHYGPRRLAANTLGAGKKKVSSKYLSSFLRMNQNRIKLAPISQWQIQGKFVTVIKASNMTSEILEFDPRAFRGKLLFAASMSPSLAPNGELNSETLWGFITDTPFNKAIKVR